MTIIKPSAGRSAPTLGPRASGAALVAAILVGSAMFGCGTGRAAGRPAVKPGQTVVSLEFDDGFATQWEARRLLADRHLRATFFIVSGAVGTPGYLDWRQVGALQSDGNEIAGHTVTHPHLAALAVDEARREICLGRQALLDRGFPVTDMAYPYGSYNRKTEQIAAECGYNSARTIDGPDPSACPTCAHAERIPPVDAYATRGVFLATDTTDAAALEAAVTDAESHGGGWVHVVVHRLCDGCDRVSTTPAVLAAFLEWLAPRQRSGTVVRTVREVVGGPVRPPVAAPAATPPIGASNALPNASLEQDADGDGVPDCWSETGYGEGTATWTRTADSHGGGSALRLDVSSLRSGDRKLVLSQDLGTCSPSAAPGASYRVTAWYRASAQPILVAFSRDASGHWQYWSESPPLAPSSAWTQANWTTPPAPGGTAGLSVGVLLKTPGSLTVDDLSLTAA